MIIIWLMSEPDQEQSYACWGIVVVVYTVLPTHKLADYPNDHLPHALAGLLRAP